jgi:hypothetical protein
LRCFGGVFALIGLLHLAARPLMLGNPALEPIWLSIAVIAVFVLIWGGWRQFRAATGPRAILMWICAVVLLGNLLIWSI